MQQANSQARAAASAQKRGQDTAVENQNKLVEQNYEKRRKALGLGSGSQGVLGDQASQSGGVLTSVTDGNQNAMGL